MDHRHSTVAILALGGVVLALEPGLSAPPYGTGSATWIPVAGIYLVVGCLFGVPRVLGTDRTSVRYAIQVAAVSALLPMDLRVRDLLIARPELALPDATFVLTRGAVFVPIVVGFMASLGVAERSRERYFALAVLVAVILVTLVGEKLTGSSTGFGAAFVVVYYGFWSVAGALFRLPLYLYGWSLGDRLPEIAGRLLFPSRSPPSSYLLLQEPVFPFARSGRHPRTRTEASGATLFANEPVKPPSLLRRRHEHDACDDGA